ncbi:MAG: nucleotide exchange factor GrpE [Elainellaceae cyanobacterium]
MIEDEKPEEYQPQPGSAGSAENAVSENGPTLDEVDLDLEDGTSDAPAGDSPELSQSESTTADDGAVPLAVESLQQEVTRLQAQLDERMAQYMRIAADFENFRKRMQKERQDLEVQVKCSTISEMLPVVDNFERARSQIKPQTDGEMTIHKSYQGVYKQLVDALKKLGVSPMRAEGEQFDPNLHEAVMREPTREYEDGVVIEQLMRGYTLAERVLRHAMVKVATSDGVDVEADSAAED